MAPKLRAWRLQYEERHLKGQATRVLVLRNERGVLRKVAKSVSEEAELKRLYRKYNQTTRTEDLPVSKKLRRKLALVIRKLREQGFIHREICFGTTRNSKTGKREYKRVEVFKATPWTRRERQRIWYFFKVHIPKSNLGIYVIHQNKTLQVSCLEVQGSERRSNQGLRGSNQTLVEELDGLGPWVLIRLFRMLSTELTN